MVTKFKYSLRARHDISEVIDVFISEDMDIEDITQWREDMNFMFEWQE